MWSVFILYSLRHKLMHIVWLDPVHCIERLTKAYSMNHCLSNASQSISGRDIGSSTYTQQL